MGGLFSSTRPTTASEQIYLQHLEVLKKSTTTQQVINTIGSYMIKELRLQDYYSLSSPTESKKYIVITAQALDRVFASLDIFPDNSPKQILYFRKVSDLVDPQSAELKQRRFANCKRLAYFYVRIFQLYGALSLSIIDDITLVQHAGISSPDSATRGLGGLGGLGGPGDDIIRAPGANPSVVPLTRHHGGQHGGQHGEHHGGQRGGAGALGLFDFLDEISVQTSPTLFQLEDKSLGVYGMFTIIPHTGFTEGFFNTTILQQNYKFILKFKAKGIESNLNLTAVGYRRVVPGEMGGMRGMGGIGGYGGYPGGYGMGGYGMGGMGMTAGQFSQLPTDGDFTVKIDSTEKSAKIEAFKELVNTTRAFLREKIQDQKERLGDGSRVRFDTGGYGRGYGREYGREYGRGESDSDRIVIKDIRDTDPKLQYRGVFDAISYIRPAPHCISRAIQLLRKDTITDICSDRFLVAKTATGQRSSTQTRAGVPMRGESLKKSPGIVSLDNLFYTIDSATSADPTMSKTAINEYKIFIKTLWTIFGHGKSDGLIDSANRTPADLQGKLLSITDDRAERLCKGQRKAMQVKKDSSAYKIIRESIAGLYRRQLEQVSFVAKMFGMIFVFSKSSDGHIKIAFQPALLKGGIPYLNKISGIARLGLIKYYTQCENMYTNALVKIFRIPDGKKSFRNASQTGVGGVDTVRAQISPSIFDKLPAVGDRRIIGESDLRRLEPPPIYNNRGSRTNMGDGADVGADAGAGAGAGAGMGTGMQGSELVDLQERINLIVGKELSGLRAKIRTGFIRNNVFNPLAKAEKYNYFNKLRDAINTIRTAQSREDMNITMNGLSAINNFIGAHIYDENRGSRFLVDTSKKGGEGTIILPFNYPAICAQFDLYKEYIIEGLKSRGGSVPPDLEAINCEKNINVGVYMMQVLFGILGYRMFSFSEMFHNIDITIILKYLQNRENKINGFMWHDNNNWYCYKKNSDSKTFTFYHAFSSKDIRNQKEELTNESMFQPNGELFKKIHSHKMNLYYIKYFEKFIFDVEFIKIFRKESDAPIHIVQKTQQIIDEEIQKIKAFTGRDGQIKK